MPDLSIFYFCCKSYRILKAKIKFLNFKYFYTEITEFSTKKGRKGKKYNQMSSLIQIL